VTGDFCGKSLISHFGFFIISKKKREKASSLLASQKSIGLEDGGGRW
jgi:hypothetical protein